MNSCYVVYYSVSCRQNHARDGEGLGIKRKTHYLVPAFFEVDSSTEKRERLQIHTQWKCTMRCDTRIVASHIVRKMPRRNEVQSSDLHSLILRIAVRHCDCEFSCFGEISTWREYETILKNQRSTCSAYPWLFPNRRVSRNYTVIPLGRTGVAKEGKCEPGHARSTTIYACFEGCYGYSQQFMQEKRYLAAISQSPTLG